MILWTIETFLKTKNPNFDFTPLYKICLEVTSNVTMAWGYFQPILNLLPFE